MKINKINTILLIIKDLNTWHVTGIIYSEQINKPRRRQCYAGQLHF
jgi:hypothetical protein